MQNGMVSKSFEHLQTQTLPHKVHKIISSIVKRHRHTSGELNPKQLELAAAFLRMRLYQAFGPDSKQYIEHSMQELERRLLAGTSTGLGPQNSSLDSFEYST